MDEMLSASRDEVISGLYQQGLSQHAIARQVQLSQPGVRKALLRLGLITASDDQEADSFADNSEDPPLVNPNIQVTDSQDFSASCPDNPTEVVMTKPHLPGPDYSHKPGEFSSAQGDNYGALDCTSEQDAPPETIAFVISQPDNPEAGLVRNSEIRAELEAIAWAMMERRGTANVTDLHSWGRQLLKIAQQIMITGIEHPTNTTPGEE